MKRYWTPERVLDGLKKAMTEVKGKLPCSDSAYNKLRADYSGWPPTLHVLEYHHSIARAWLDAGAPKKRVSLHNVSWTTEEDEYLLSNAGSKNLSAIATYLCRSYGSVKTRLNKFHKLKARENQGFVSAAVLAGLYNCSYHRIRTALSEGKIPGKYDSVHNMWLVDMKDITEEVEALLKKPRRTHKTHPIDKGDYYQRYGIHRTRINGQVVRIETGV